jgi:pimeloyl-ACP methyl ester carboxylesterase
MSDSLLYIEDLSIDNAPFRAYFVRSTAPINVEEGGQENITIEPQQKLVEITNYLKENRSQAEVLVLLHGYNTSQGSAKWRYEQICRYIRDQYGANVPRKLLVIGYRWPSETVGEDESGKAIAKMRYSLFSLPKLLSICLWVSVALTPLAVLGGLFKLVLLATVPLLLVIVTLLLLRITNYFRDTFRANQYGVPDFVEFIRQLDRSLVGDEKQEVTYWRNNRIRLSFVGHSMGAFVITNAVRILSDVFDRTSIGTLNNQRKCPSPAIGNAFYLGRLVLVAPDIPADTIISGRANTLRSSLRRFEEAYLFCNGNDIVLKTASSSANYFSFPSKTRDGGQRLGVVSVSESYVQQKAGKPQRQQFGIVNLPATLSGVAAQTNYLDYLFIRPGKPLSIRQAEISKGGRSIAGLFTFVDCSDYTEVVNGKPLGIAGDRNPIQFVRRTLKGSLDTHGGYIYDDNAHLSKRMIYGLACLGFRDFLQTLDSNRPAEGQLQFLSQLCEERQIQMLLATERYEGDLMGKPIDRDGY